MPKVYLIPVGLDENAPVVLSPSQTEVLRGLRFFLAEEEKAARRSVKRMCPDFSFAESEFLPLNEHTSSDEVRGYLDRAAGRDIGIISESGCPCVADPGSDIVLMAHGRGWQVVPWAGPSSILLAVMASGLGGQNFAFTGYLPKEREPRRQRIKALEKRSFDEGQAQVFMETPYRNAHVLEDVLDCCDQRTLLSVALSLTGPSEDVRTRPVEEWRKDPPKAGKQPAVFVLLKPRKV